MTSRVDARPKRRWLLVALLLLLVVSLTSCGTVRYYSQAVTGGAKVLLGRESIDKLLRQDRLPDDLREKLELARAIRRFATKELALPDNGSYTSYVDVGRPYVVWNVTAAPPLSLDPERWCFPIAGCVSYRGYFRERAAQRFAQRLADDGLDVTVGGVRAYSTLGWFADPLLSTFLDLPEADLAAILFHELAHQVVYISGNTTLSESFATTVEREGVRRWLRREGGPGQAAVEAWEATQRFDELFLAVALETRRELEAVYASDGDETSRRAAKAAVLERIRARYTSEIRPAWEMEGYSGSYDGWFAADLNNAHFVSLADYTARVPELEQLLERLGGDLERFYERVRALAEESSTSQESARF